MQEKKAEVFKALHEGDAFGIPNPWDAGAARVLEALGFKALATTSSGFAFTLGRPDGGVTLDELARHVRLDRAVERIEAAREAAGELGFPFVLTARAENHIRGNPDLDDTIVRLQAYERAGADVLFAPGLGGMEEIRAVCEAVGRPVNVLARPGLSVAEIVGAGARRISVGGGLAWASVEAMAVAAEAVRDSGDFSGLGSPARIREWFAD